ncbi:MAG: prolyl oligopeptidase family serine peptidase [Synoicihabitans sp.]
MLRYRHFVPLLLLVCASLAVRANQTAERLTLSTGETVRFWQYTPPDQEGALPLLLFLHGGGESGDNLEVVKKHGPPALIEQGKSFPAIVLSPQLDDRRGFWDEDLLARFLTAFAAKNNVDSTRVYLTGLSRGAYGALRLAMENPERFAGIVVISGAAPAPYARWLGDTPVRLFHGEDDQAIPVAESTRIFEALQRAGADAELTIYPDIGHDAWTQTYANPLVWDWLFRQRRKAE